ncbi:MAG: hypothetical protein JXO51_02575 [Candidatus Aminicenantes bacterium]|nr:hypothetical protein [Candidatus Aminicenantes bacterium]
MPHIRKHMFVSCALLCLALSAFPRLCGQDVFKEFINVSNIELIVRVSDQGKLVRGLKKSDFRLFINDRLVPIHGCNEFHAESDNGKHYDGNEVTFHLPRKGKYRLSIEAVD